ncbi:MAG: hypothetical protein NTW08_08410 [Gammaproteobacteria bacterium]|nr:hypothetical protein [Gammaproteobacteria bacterium]
MPEWNINLINNPQEQHIQITLDMAGYLALVEKYHALANDNVAGRQAAIAELRAYKQNILFGLMSPLFWSTVLEQLKSTVADTSSPLYCYLVAPFCNATTPLVFDCLNLHFPEIIKNCMDAFITKSMKERQADAVLRIDVKTGMSGEQFFMCFKDNGCGFSATQLDDLEAFKGRVCDHNDKPHRQVPIYFGGNSRGLRMLRDHLWGFVRNASRVDENICEVKPGQSDIFFSNHETGGAMIVLSSCAMRPEQLESTATQARTDSESHETIVLTLPVKRRLRSQVDQPGQPLAALPSSPEPSRTSVSSPGPSFFSPSPTSSLELKSLGAPSPASQGAFNSPI